MLGSPQATPRGVDFQIFLASRYAVEIDRNLNFGAELRYRYHDWGYDASSCVRSFFARLLVAFYCAVGLFGLYAVAALLASLDDWVPAVVVGIISFVLQIGNIVWNNDWPACLCCRWRWYVRHRRKRDRDRQRRPDFAMSVQSAADSGPPQDQSTANLGIGMSIAAPASAEASQDSSAASAPEGLPTPRVQNMQILQSAVTNQRPLRRFWQISPTWLCDINWIVFICAFFLAWSLHASGSAGLAAAFSSDFDVQAAGSLLGYLLAYSKFRLVVLSILARDKTHILRELVRASTQAYVRDHKDELKSDQPRMNDVLGQRP